MLRRCLVWTGFLLLAIGSRASALDRVRLQGVSQPVNGNLTEMSRTAVKIEQGSIPKKFEVSQIEFIEFDDEPKDLRNARNVMKAGKYADALELVKKVKTADIKRAEIKQDAEFYKAILMARLAMEGDGSPADAGKLLLNFEKKNGTNYHYFDACEALGDLLVADRKFDRAEPFYAKVASAPWPDYRVRAAVLMGRTLEAQKQFEKAIQKYEEAEAMDGDGKDVERQKLAAALGKATSEAGLGKTEEAIAQIETIISKGDVENVELFARAYNALGRCFQVAGKTREALWNYLHVDVLYLNVPEQHAEALANLATLWKADGKADRANEAHEQLVELYPNSRWAKK